MELHKWIQQEIKILEEIRNQLDTRIANLKQEYSILTGMPSRTARPRGIREVVSRIQIEPYIETWLDQHEREYGYRGINRLAQMAGIAPLTITTIVSGTNSKGEEQKWVRLDTVDKLLVAMNMPHVMQELEIVHLDWSSRVEVPKPPFSHYEEN